MIAGSATACTLVHDPFGCHKTTFWTIQLLKNLEAYFIVIESSAIPLISKKLLEIFTRI